MRELSNDELAEVHKKMVARMGLLTPEQLVVVKRWEAEKTARLKLLDQAWEAAEQGDSERERELLMAVCKVSLSEDPNRCEHGRSIVSTCMACEEIERILTPELFEDE